MWGSELPPRPPRPVPESENLSDAAGLGPKSPSTVTQHGLPSWARANRTATAADDPRAATAASAVGRRVVGTGHADGGAGALTCGGTPCEGVESTLRGSTGSTPRLSRIAQPRTPDCCDRRVGAGRRGGEPRVPEAPAGLDASVWAAGNGSRAARVGRCMAPETAWPPSQARAEPRTTPTHHARYAAGARTAPALLDHLDPGAQGDRRRASPEPASGTSSDEAAWPPARGGGPCPPGSRRSCPRTRRLGCRPRRRACGWQSGPGTSGRG